MKYSQADLHVLKIYDNLFYTNHTHEGVYVRARVYVYIISKCNSKHHEYFS